MRQARAAAHAVVGSWYAQDGSSAGGSRAPRLGVADSERERVRGPPAAATQHTSTRSQFHVSVRVKAVRVGRRLPRVDMAAASDESHELADDVGRRFAAGPAFFRGLAANGRLGCRVRDGNAPPSLSLVACAGCVLKTRSGHPRTETWRLGRDAAEDERPLGRESLLELRCCCRRALLPATAFPVSRATEIASECQSNHPVCDTPVLQRLRLAASFLRISNMKLESARSLSRRATSLVLRRLAAQLFCCSAGGGDGENETDDAARQRLDRLRGDLATPPPRFSEAPQRSQCYCPLESARKAN